jgi:Protein of unknown function (DUF2934)
MPKVGSGMSMHDLIGAIQKGVWEVDCADITLRQNGTTEPTVFSGPGYLRQGEGGTVEYKVYVTTTHAREIWETQFGGVSGKLLESSRYYTLHATDRFGNRWENHRTNPEIGSSEIDGSVHHFIDGKLHDLTYSRNSGLPEHFFKLKMFFFVEVEIPCAAFSTSIGNFRVSNQAGVVLVEVDSECQLPKNIEIRIVESLALVLAKPLFWNVIERYDNGIETVRLRGDRGIPRAKLMPPVGCRFTHQTGEVWRLFEKFLTFVCGYSEERMHPCSRHIFSALEASAGTIHAQALALSVAVEGIVKHLFPKAGSLPEGLRPKVQDLRLHFKNWEGFKDEYTKNALWQRVQDMLGKILDISTKSKLHALATANAIYEEHVKAWGDIRNKSAHGEMSGSENLQALVDLCHKVMVLMYHLIFCAVGFEGIYIDYSTHGWRPKRYRGRPVTADEIAVAAYFMWEQSGHIHGKDIEHWFNSKEQLEKGII